MRRLILGTAGHIDHGKTELVRALTDVDTDRLKEEKERGITIDLGFAEFAPGGETDVRFGVVDVPGHEGFVKNMLAGATGMDVVVLVVAADEGVMPQTREHLAIVRLLGVERLVVAVTKADLVEEAWLELVRDEVRELLAPGPYDAAPVVVTSARSGRGLEELTEALLREGGAAAPSDPGDLARLPVDRVFTIRGTGTVVTGTLWSGRLAAEGRVRLLPGELEARIRGLQVHGRDVAEAGPGERVAVALSGSGVDREAIQRGQTLVTDPGWSATTMLTAHLSVLPETGWAVEDGQRVRVHLGTSEVMARVVLLGGEPVLGPGGEGWVQLRLETPLVARARDRFVLRSYSPVTTIAGGRVAEPLPSKRTRLVEGDAGNLDALLHGSPEEAVGAALRIRRWEGAEPERLPVLVGRPPAAVERALESLRDAEVPTAGGRVFGAESVARARDALLEAVESFHEREPLSPGMPLERLRQALPGEAAGHLADPVLARLEEAGRLRIEEGVAALADFRPSLSPEQEEARARLRDLYREAGLAPPAVRELPEALRTRPDLPELLRLMEAAGEIRALDEDLFVVPEALERAAREVEERLAGRSGLGPADFREVLSLTRKHLLPVLHHLDGRGVTVRRDDLRDVPGPSGAA